MAAVSTLGATLHCLTNTPLDDDCGYVEGHCVKKTSWSKTFQPLDEHSY